MAKTLENLTMAEQEILQGFMDAFGCTEAEALDMALTDGAIKEVTGGGLRFAPDEYKELKFYRANNKSHFYKIDKKRKNAGIKEALFEEDCFFYDTKISKDDKGEYKLDECSTTNLGATPEIIVLGTFFKAKRATFDSQGKADPTNFDTTMEASLAKAHQDSMILLGSDQKGLSALKVRDLLKKEYGDLDKVPEKLKVKFRTMLYGLVKVEGEWKRFYIEVSNKMEDENKLTYFFDKDTAGKIIKAKFINTLELTGDDNNENPIIQIKVSKEMSLEEFNEIKGEIQSATKALSEFRAGQLEYIKAETSSGTKPKPQVEEVDDSDEDPFAK